MLLRDSNVVVKQHALETFAQFAEATAHESVVPETIASDPKLQEVVVQHLNQVSDIFISLNFFSRSYNIWKRNLVVWNEVLIFQMIHFLCTFYSVLNIQLTHCDKPLSEPMMVELLTYISVTHSQWVNSFVRIVMAPHCDVCRS